MKHKHYDLIVQWASDPEAWVVEYRSVVTGRFIPIGFESYPEWHPETEYRLIPKRRMSDETRRLVDSFGNALNSNWPDYLTSEFPEHLALLAYIERIERERDEARDLAERLKLEAQAHAQEARTANASLAECYRAATGATGEPGNWHGAEPVVRRFAELEAENARLRPNAERYEWLRERYGQVACTTELGVTGRYVTKIDVLTQFDAVLPESLDAAIDAASKQTPTLICPECGADRFRELCPRIVGDCPMVGHAQIIERAGRAARKP